MSAEQIRAFAALFTPVVALIIGIMTFLNGRRLKKVHVLVNSKMGAQLLVAWKALERTADMTGDLVDRDIADQARQLYIDHEIQTEKAGP